MMTPLRCPAWSCQPDEANVLGVDATLLVLLSPLERNLCGNRISPTGLSIQDIRR